MGVGWCPNPIVWGIFTERKFGRQIDTHIERDGEGDRDRESHVKEKADIREMQQKQGKSKLLAT